MEEWKRWDVSPSLHLFIIFGRQAFVIIFPTKSENQLVVYRLPSAVAIWIMEVSTNYQAMTIILIRDKANPHWFFSWYVRSSNKLENIIGILLFLQLNHHRIGTHLPWNTRVTNDSQVSDKIRTSFNCVEFFSSRAEFFYANTRPHLGWKGRELYLSDSWKSDVEYVFSNFVSPNRWHNKRHKPINFIIAPWKFNSGSVYSTTLVSGTLINNYNNEDNGKTANRTKRWLSNEASEQPRDVSGTATTWRRKICWKFFGVEDRWSRWKSSRHEEDSKTRT